MVCQACGGPVGPDVKFCARCGAQVAAPPPAQYAAPAYGAPQQQYAYVPPPMMMVSRVQRHLQTLGTVWLVYAAYRVVMGLFGMFFVRAVMYRRWSGGGFPFGHHGYMFGPPWMHLMPVIMAFLVVGSVLAAVVGYSLLARRTWGRVLAVVAAVLVLFKPVMGTALGIYTLWVLAPAVSGIEYDAIAEPD
ncbi:MAG: zinc ribbon domain-containing protein [Acidobacteria bacterium]|nr:zinc ribbon domain-containing protein [Acidobacteriota bacterium]